MGWNEYHSDNGAKAVCLLIVFIVIVAIITGILFAGSELFDRSRAQAEADRLNAETEAIRAQTAYEEHRRQLELQAAKEQAAYEKQIHEMQLQTEAQKAAAEVQAHQRLQEIQEWFWEGAAKTSLVVFPIAVTVLVSVSSYYLITKANTFRKESKLRKKTETSQSLPSASGSVDRGSVSPVNSAPVIQSANVQDSRRSYDGLLGFWVDFVAKMKEALVIAPDWEQPDLQRVYYPGGIKSEIALAYLLALRRARVVSAKVNGHLEWTLQRAFENLDDIALRISSQTFDKFLQNHLKSDLEELERLLAQSDGCFRNAVFSAEMEPTYTPS